MTCKWLTIQQMADHLQVSSKTISRWIKAGKLTSMQIGDKHKLTRVCAKVRNSNIILAKPEDTYARLEDASLKEELNKYPDTEEF